MILGGKAKISATVLRRAAQGRTGQTYKGDSAKDFFFFFFPNVMARTSFSVFSDLLLPSVGKMKRAGKPTRAPRRREPSPTLPGPPHPEPISSCVHTDLQVLIQVPRQLAPTCTRTKGEVVLLTPPRRTLNTHIYSPPHRWLPYHLHKCNCLIN